MRTWYWLVIILGLGAFILYRSYALDARVDLLSKEVARLGTAQLRNNSSVNAEKRLSDLEAKYESFTQKMGGITNADPKSANNAIANLDALIATKHFDERVLSLLDAEKQKAIDTQLKWHRDAVVKYRMDSLNYFANDQKLTAGQLSALRALLEDEVDKMVEMLRNPELITDHAKGLAAWIRVIRETDKEAGEVLNDQQNKVFRHLRRLEQQALMPWLPEKDRS
jgi:hypothetical protein